MRLKGLIMPYLEATIVNKNDHTLMAFIKYRKVRVNRPEAMSVFSHHPWSCHP